MSRPKTALYLLEQLRQDPRLAYLIGPGSEAFDLLTRDAAQAQGLDIDVARTLYSKDLTFQTLPRIYNPLAITHGSGSGGCFACTPDLHDTFGVPTC